MGEQQRKPGRPRKWTPAERMRATRAAKRVEREAISRRAERDFGDIDRRRSEAPVLVDSPVAREPVADHTECEATIGALRRELVDLEERYDDLVLSRWMLSRKYEHALGRMRTHDPAGIVWLVELSPTGSATSRRSGPSVCKNRTGNWCGVGTRRSSIGG